MGQRMAKGENVPSNAEKVTTTIPAHAYIDRGEVYEVTTVEDRECG